MTEKKIYVKDESYDPIYKVKNSKFLLKSRLLPASLVLSGFLLLSTQVVVPLVFFKSSADSTSVDSSVLGVMTGFKDFEFSELDSTSAPLIDNSYKAVGALANDSSVKGLKKAPSDKSEFFSLSIPKLGIKNARVELNSTKMDPQDSLGHYAGTAIPGKVGNSFIYGHSVLPWFFNPENYKTIFSTLEDLEAGDSVEIKYNNETLTYVVESMEILVPHEVDPLKEVKPSFLNESTITLMTCVPPGTKLKRLLVYAVKD